MKSKKKSVRGAMQQEVNSGIVLVGSSRLLLVQIPIQLFDAYPGLNWRRLRRSFF